MKKLSISKTSISIANIMNLSITKEVSLQNNMCVPKLHSTCEAITGSFFQMYIFPKNQEHTNLNTLFGKWKKS